MKKINFVEFPLIQGIKGEVKSVDLHEMFADGLYVKGQGMAALAVALKIYNSTGELEFNDREIETITQFAGSYCSPNFIDSLRKVLEEQ